MAKLTSEKLPTEERAVNHLPLLFATLMIVMLLASLSQMILSTALPAIVGELHGVENMMWVITVYMLTSTVSMPVYGKFGDQFGRKPMLLFAIAFFLVGSILGGLAQDMSWLIIARGIQGLGGGGLMILSQAMVADLVPARERGKFVGVIGGVFAVSSIAGPLLGGWFTEGPGWRWAFWINIPLVVLAVTAIITLMPSLQNLTTKNVRIDYLGIALISLITTSIILAATWAGHQYAWTSPQILGLTTGAVVVSCLFIITEKRVEHPVIPLFLFKNLNFVLSTWAGLATSIAMFGALSYLPTYFQMADGVSATGAGLLMIPMMTALLIASVGVGLWVSKSGRYKLFPIIGSFVMALGLWMLSTITIHSSLQTICFYMAVLGLGLGMSLQILTLIVQNEFPHRIVGTATAANNYFRQVGSSLGSAVVGSMFVARLTSLLLERLPAGALSSHGDQSLTPTIVAAMPSGTRGIIISSYNDALVPIFVYMVPLGLIAGVLLVFLKKTPLATEITKEIPAEALSEGQVLVTEFEEDNSQIQH